MSRKLGVFLIAPFLFLAFVAPLWAQEIPQMSIHRPGAGAPAGWKVEMEHCTLEAAAESGPCGVGAALIAFQGKGSFRLISPACRMRVEANHAVALWVRSEPAGAQVEFTISDNDDEGGSCLKKTFDTTSEWQCLLMQGVLPKSVKGAYFLTVAIKAGEGAVWMDGLHTEACVEAHGEDWRPKLFPAGVVLAPESSWGVVTGDETMRVRARAVGATMPGCQIRLKAVHTNGAASELPAIPLDATGVWRGAFEITGAIANPFGMLRVEGEVVNAEGRPLSAMSETLLTRAPEPASGPRLDSPFGIHVRLQEPQVSAVAKLGYKWCRIHDANGDTKWGIIEPQPGRWLWFDEEMAMVRRHGLSILGMLDSAPPWETGADERGYFSIYHAPKNMDNWRNYVRQVVGHYAGVIDQWEVWNEPWDMGRFFQGGSPFLYADLLKAAYREAKSANPNCTIIGLDTYPALWETAVLLNDALPYYDLASWHRYDPNLAGRPRDNIDRVTRRIESAQAAYGAPKPTLCTEGGIDTTLYHGSFFSFADPAIVGGWSEGADRYTRFYLSAIAAGNKRVITYSVHNDPRHGLPTHMMVEPGFLNRPMHAALAGLAHFIEGGTYEKRLIPALDISAHVFAQPETRNFAEGPSTVVVLHADGEDAVDLPRPLPASVRCFDRWGNPCETPKEATRSLVYLVASGEGKAALMAALQDAPAVGSAVAGDVKPLIQSLAAALVQDQPMLWPLFSAQGSLAVCARPGQAVVANRNMLRNQPELAAAFALPGDTVITRISEPPAGLFAITSFTMGGAGGEWEIHLTAVRDGLGGAWRLLSLTLMPAGASNDSGRVQACMDILNRWEAAFRTASTKELHGLYLDGPCCLATNTLNGEYLVFSDPEQLITMTNTAVLWGKSARSSMFFEKVALGGSVATFTGAWDISSLSFGAGVYPVTATLVETPVGWKLAHICVSAPEASPLQQMIGFISNAS